MSSSTLLSSAGKSVLGSIFALSMLGSIATASDKFPEELPEEDIGIIQELPSEYPKDWVFLHDMNFISPVDGKAVLFDPTADTRNYKGSLGMSQFASFAQGTKRPELYVSETFYTRGTRGDRIDVLTIHDRENMAAIAEIVLPDGKRGQMMPQKTALSLTNNERFIMVYNFTPAASVYIIDLDKREIVNEVQIPGCSLVYPLGKQGFATMCGDGTMTAFNLDDDGEAKRGDTTKFFNDMDEDPLFLKSVEVNGMTYFASFKGRIQPVDLSDKKAKVKKDWRIADGKIGPEGWRPAGWQMITADDTGDLIYVLMNEGAGEGDHKNGGGEVWAIDPKAKKLVRRIPMPNWAISIEVTHGETPYLIVTNGNLEADVFNASTGEYLRTFGGGAAQHAFAIHAVK